MHFFAGDGFLTRLLWAATSKSQLRSGRSMASLLPMSGSL